MDCRDRLDFQNQGNPEILPSWSGFFLRLVDSLSHDFPDWLDCLDL